MRRALPRRRRRCRSITTSPSASPIRYNAFGPIAFSKRDSVGCEASASPCDRIASHQQLLDRVLGRARRVVAVRVPAGDGKHPLADQLIQCVPDLARLTIVRKAAAQSFGQPQPLLARFE